MIRFNGIPKLLAAFALAQLCGISAVVDRVAVVINKTVYTESEVLEELRLTELLNGEPLDLGPTARRNAADHLVDQELIRDEMQATGYTPSGSTDADVLLRDFRQQHFPSTTAYQAALEHYGITEDQLKQRLVWQVTALRFADFRFGSEVSANNATSADRSENENNVDDQMTAWLKQARDTAKVVFKAEAFQ
jgi:hypothetical protein